MSAIDYPGLLAQLEQQRAASVTEIADLDVIIAAVRQRASRGLPAGLTLPPARLKSAPSPQKNGGMNGTHTTKDLGGRPRGGRLAADKVATIRAQYEAGVSGPTIAQRTGVGIKTVYKLAKRGGWKRIANGKAMPIGTFTATPAGHKLSGTVRCNHCGEMTGFDPCEHCHKTLTRKW